MTLDKAAGRLADRAETIWNRVHYWLLFTSFWEVMKWPMWLRRLWLLTLPVALPLQIFATALRLFLALAWFLLGCAVAAIIGVTILLPCGAAVCAHHVWSKR